MSAYASGNEHAFSELYNRYEPRIYGFLLNRLSLKHKDLCSDLFQKTWLSIHSSRKSFDPTKKFSSWIFTIALNALRDHLSLKAEKAEKTSLEDTLEISSDHNQEQELLAAELRRNIRAVIDQLPATQKEVVLLCELEGFSSADVATMMNLSDGAVRQLLFRARGTIKKIFKEGM
jgi:RNA polymerase sigma-70 factor (ECF subfamily)